MLQFLIVRLLLIIKLIAQTLQQRCYDITSPTQATSVLVNKLPMEPAVMIPASPLPSAPNLELRNYDIGIPILPYCGGSNPSTVLKHEHNMFITAWIRVPSGGTATYLCEESPTNVSFQTNNFLERCKVTSLLTSYKENWVDYAMLNPSGQGPTADSNNLYNADPTRNWEKYIIRVKVRIEPDYEGSRIAVFRVKGEQEHRNGNRVTSTSGRLAQELLSKCSNLRMSEPSDGWLTNTPPYTNHFILKTSQCNIQGITQYHVPESLWSDIREKFMKSVLFGGYSKLLQKFEFSATDHTYLSYYLDGVYDQQKVFKFFNKREWLGLNLLKDDYFSPDNPLPKFFGVPFSKQNEVRNNENDLSEVIFRDSSAVINLQLKCGFWNQANYFFKQIYSLRYLKTDQAWISMNENNSGKFIEIQMHCISASKNTNPAFFQCQFGMNYRHQNGSWTLQNLDWINVYPPTQQKDYTVNFAVYLYPADLSAEYQNPPGGYRPAFVTRLSVSFTTDNLQKTNQWLIVKNFGAVGSMNFREQKWFWIQERVDWTNSPTTDFWNNLYVMVSDISFINGGASYEMFTINGSPDYKQRRIVSPPVGNYDEYTISRSDEIACLNAVAFTPEACGNCFDYNFIQTKELKCVDQWLTQIDNPLLNTCWESRNNVMCRNCKNDWDREAYYYDPMRRGYCREVTNKCPHGQGFFKPVSGDQYLQRMCVTCPLNCKSCYGTQKLCQEKWPANSLNFNAPNQSLIIPDCAVPGCKRCEETPCDECIEGKIVKIGLVSGPQTGYDLDGKRYSCVDRHEQLVCPTTGEPKRLARVIHTRPDKPDFCLETYDGVDSNDTEFYWNTNQTTPGLMGFEETINGAPDYLVYRECSIGCRLCGLPGIIFGSPDCQSCDQTNTQYNFPQSKIDMHLPCKGASLGDQCSSRNLTNSCLSCNPLSLPSSVPPSNYALTWKDAFNLECGCQSGFYWNPGRTACLTCPEYCK